MHLQKRLTFGVHIIILVLSYVFYIKLKSRMFFYEYPTLSYHLKAVFYYRFVYINSIFTY